MYSDELSDSVDLRQCWIQVQACDQFDVSYLRTELLQVVGWTLFFGRRLYFVMIWTRQMIFY